MNRILTRQLLSLVLLCAPVGAHAQQDEDRELTVKDLSYGVALYDFYQNRHLDAITEIDVGEYKQALSNQPDDARILKGGLYFSYGLSEDAEKIFSDLLEKKTDKDTQNRIWFSLARIEFDKGNHETGGEYLGRIEGVLPARYEDQKQYLLNGLNISKKQYGQAARNSDRISDRSIWKAYTQYNLGVALKQNWEGSKDWLTRVEKVARFSPRDEEMLALADRAQLALGLYSMEKKDVNRAIAYMSKVRSSGPLSNSALLASGWAWSRVNAPDRALSFWNALRDRNQSDQASQEALLAIPHAYEQKGNLELSALFFDQAANRFDQLLVEIEDAIVVIQNGELIHSLRMNRELEEKIPSTRSFKLPRTVATPFLFNDFAGKEFQVEVRRLNELLDIQDFLVQWRNDLPALELMLNERRKAFISKRPQVEEYSGFEQLNKLQQQRDALAKQVNEIVATEDYLALANEQEREHLEILGEVKTRLQTLKSQRDVSDEKERYRLYTGLLNYQIATDYPSRIYELQRDLKLLDRALEQAQRSSRSLQQASGQNETRLGQLLQRIKTQYGETTQLDNRVSTLIDRQEQHLNSLVVTALRARQENLKQLRLNARYSLVRLYDQISVRQAAKQ